MDFEQLKTYLSGHSKAIYAGNSQRTPMDTKKVTHLSNNEKEHSGLVNTILQQLERFDIQGIDTIYRGVKLVDKNNSCLGSVDLVVLTSKEFYVVNGRIISKKNKENRMYLLRKRLRLAHDYFKEKHNAIPILVGIYRVRGSMKLQKRPVMARPPTSWSFIF